MHLIEWMLWRTHTQKITASNTHNLCMDLFEDEVSPSINFDSASDHPKTQSPIFEFNETQLEIRCGGAVEKRGAITLMTLGGLTPFIYTSATITLADVFTGITNFTHTPLLSLLLTFLMLLFDIAVATFYIKYVFKFTRMEILTSRHLLIRFNRKTQQVHLHRPRSCGGVATFSWRMTASSAISPKEDSATNGMRLVLAWHPLHTGLPYPEMVFVGKQGQGGSELRDEWEFIRRFMEEGPEGLPRPRLSTRFPSPIQAFSAQFEGIGRFFRKSSWLFKVAMLMVWPAFVVLGTCHWVSLMLCWRPRWPKIIREAGQPGKPIPPLTTLSDYPPEIQKRLLANADRWALKPGKRPEKKPRKPRIKKAPEPDTGR
ncbi:hypothetical protein HU719_004555 [Pseudomonas sp. SWRI107]|uniref:DUF6708 domain-containing protein n=1 Tax=Pseudomonas farsensis TaxID=2745492 RepID=UPI0016480D3E|nr:DUF6708 domain-containing protein [Pseudomonas farsensis]MBV4530679.1 hypothetical protein [Pseudomonas farsensis]